MLNSVNNPKLTTHGYYMHWCTYSSQVDHGSDTTKLSTFNSFITTNIFTRNNFLKVIDNTLHRVIGYR